MTKDTKGSSLIVQSGNALTGATKGVAPGTLDKLRALKMQREEAAKQQAEAAKKPKKIALIFDATASRQATWDRAQEQMAGVLSDLQTYGKTEFAIYCHRGGESEFLGQFRDGGEAARAMRRINCQAGTTNITGCFAKVAGNDEKPAALIVIGDCVDGYQDTEWVVENARALGIKAFALHEDTNGYDANALRQGERYHREIASVTGGAFAKLGETGRGSGGSSLKDMMTAIGAIVNGPQAIAAIKDPKVRESVKVLTTNNPGLLEYNRR